jgi:hypothetical protein
VRHRSSYNPGASDTHTVTEPSISYEDLLVETSCLVAAGVSVCSNHSEASNLDTSSLPDIS